MTIAELLQAADAALTEQERAAFIASVPGGKEVTAILADQLNRSSYLPYIMRIKAAHSHEVETPYALAVAVLLCTGLAGQDGTSCPSWEEVRPMIDRIESNLYEPNVLAEIHAERDAATSKAGKLALLAPLGFQDHEDGEAPDAIWHPVLGYINHGSVRLDNVLDLVYAAGMKRGADDLRAQFRVLLDVAPAPRPDDH